jgi:SHS2 domain-containing protein
VYRWVEHTGEVELEIDGDSERDVFLEAMEAVNELLRDVDEDEHAGVGEQRVETAISVAAADRSRLLAAWLGELAFLAETEGLIADGVSDLHIGEGTVRATLHGRHADPPHLIKAVTYHRLAFEPHDGRWRARAVLDV